VAYAPYCRRRFSIAVTARALADPSFCTLFGPPTITWPMAQSRPMPTSVVAANGLLQQKSDCETFVSAHSAAAPRSTDVDARADINEAMISACAECRTMARRACP